MDQAGKLGLGANKYTISIFKNYQVTMYFFVIEHSVVLLVIDFEL